MCTPAPTDFASLAGGVSLKWRHSRTTYLRIIHSAGCLPALTAIKNRGRWAGCVSGLTEYRYRIVWLTSPEDRSPKQIADAGSVYTLTVC